MQRDQMRHHQTQQHQWHSNHVERKKAVQGGVANHEVAADQQRQIRADERNGREQVHDHLSTPVAHLAPRQQIAHEGFGHQRQENSATENPDQLARFAVAAIHQAAEHVQVHDDEEGAGTCRVHVANQPAPRDVAHDVFDRGEGQGSVRLVVHRQKDAGDDLDHQNQQRE